MLWSVAAFMVALAATLSLIPQHMKMPLPLLLSLLAGLIVIGVRRRPLAILGVLALFVVVRADPLVPMCVLGMLILLGVIAYRYGWRTAGIGWTITWVPLASLGAFDGSTALGDGLLFSLVMAGVAAAPVAFGRYLRGVRSAADVAHERVAEAEAWRHVETRAARLAERSRLARDLHDIVAHHVGAMTLRASSARLALDTSGDTVVAAAALGDIAETGRHVLDELRGLLIVLRDPEAIDEEALLTEPKAAIADAVSRVRGAGVPVLLHVDPGLARTSLVVRTTVARIVQEALTNVLKHAGPGTATRLTVNVEGAELRLRLDNDPPAGQPPAPAALPVSGHGLAGMRDRVALLGGVLTAGPTGDGGWSVVVDLPTAPAVPALAALPAPVEAGDAA